mgnify:CR=1 FL=1
MKLVNRLLITLSIMAAFLVAAAVVRADTTHVVQPGDTLFTIAMEYGVSMDAIVEANNIVNPRVIMLGSTLIIPGVDGPPGSTPTPAAPAPTRVAPLPPGQLPPHATYVEGGVLHTVQPGESLSRISLMYNIAMPAIVEANDLANPGQIFAGQELFIPGVVGQPAPTPRPANTPAPAATTVSNTTTAAATPAPSTNLFTNGSFEGDWYYYLFNELQIPVGWQMSYHENENTLQPGSGGNFNRPEIRVVSRANLPEDEWAWFIFDGDKTLKAFKGDAPTTFALFQDVYLQPGRYRATFNFFPDIVASFDDHAFHTDPLSGEVRVIHNEGGTGWTTVTAGQPNSRVYDFTVSRPGAVRLGMDFRNRFETANNGWFLDDWQLERIGN